MGRSASAHSFMAFPILTSAGHGRGAGRTWDLNSGNSSIKVGQDLGGQAPEREAGPALRRCCSSTRLAGQTTSQTLRGTQGAAGQRTGELGVEKGAQQASDPHRGRLLANTHAPLQLSMLAPWG